MKTVTYIQVFCILFNLEAGICATNGDKKCESNIETRAVLLSCPEMDTECEDDPLSRATKGDEYRILNVRSEAEKIMEKIQREFPNRITHCKRKLIITMKLNNKGNINCDDGFIVIDHVYDPLTRGKARLLSPIVVKLRQEQMVQLYPIEFQKVVNSDPREQVFSKDNCPDYKGCSTNLDNPTCGITTYNGEIVPFSEGFCCSYDPYVNALREMSPDLHENALLYKDPGLFVHKKNRLIRSEKKTSMLINSDLTSAEANIQGLRDSNSFEEDEINDLRTAKLIKSPPNYLMEHDRQVLCSAAALLQGMCNMNLNNREGENSENEAKAMANQEVQRKYNAAENNNCEIGGNERSHDRSNINNNSVKCSGIKGTVDKYNSDKISADEFHGGKNTAYKYNGDEVNGGKMTAYKGDGIKYHDNKSISDKNKNNADIEFGYNSSLNVRTLNFMKKENSMYNSKNVNSYESQKSGEMLMNQAMNQNNLKPIILKSNRKIMNDMRSIVNIIGPSNADKPDFAGRTNFKAREDTNENIIKPDEMVSIEKEGMNYPPATRQRKKRLTRDHEENDIPFQYLPYSKMPQNKMIPGELTQVIGKCNRDIELCLEESFMNISCIPQFFFAHDRKIVCPSSLCPKCLSNSSTDAPKPLESNETPEPCDYEEAKKNDAADSDRDKIDEQHRLKSNKQNKNKFSELETSFGNRWKINAEVENGNIFRLDLIKNNDRTDDNAEKIQEMKFEQQRIYPAYVGAKPDTNRFHIEKNKHFMLPDENYLLRNSKNLFENENRNDEAIRGNHFKQTGEQHKEEETDQKCERMPGFPDGEYNVRKYKIENLFKTGIEDKLHSKGDLRNGDRSSELVEILIPNGENQYRRYNLDMGSKGLNTFWKPKSGREKSKYFSKSIDTSMDIPYEAYVENLRHGISENEFSTGQQPFMSYNEVFDRGREMNVNQLERLENQRFFDAKLPSVKKRKNFWNEPYNQQQRYQSSWNGMNRMNFRYPSNLKTTVPVKESIINPSAYIYPHDFPENNNNEYMLSGQNVFFSDRKKGFENFKEYPQGVASYDQEKGGTEGNLSRKLRLNSNSGRMRKRRKGCNEENDVENERKVTETENFHKSEGEKVSCNDIWKASKVIPEKYFYHLPNRDNEEAYDGNAKFERVRKRRKASFALEPSTGFADRNLGSILSRGVRKVRSARLVAGNNVRRSPYKMSKSSGPNRSEMPEPNPSAASEMVNSLADSTKLKSEDVNDTFARLMVRYVNQSEKSKKVKREYKMKNIKIDEERLMKSYRSLPNKCVASSFEGKSTDNAEKRQKRGDQECMHNLEVSATSPTVQGTKIYHETSHCMEYSDLWYSVYKIKKPDLSHLVGIQLYDKQISLDGTSKWREITKGYMIRLGTFLPKAEDNIPTIAMTYTPTGPNKAKGGIDTENLRLLVPTHLANDKNSNLYPEFTGGPAEYLVVQKNEISETGRECDMIGSSFEAFARQPDRCSKPPGKCLKRSPTNLWREDLEAKIRGKRGKYFLENYGNVANTSIKSYSNLTGDFLAMDYYGDYTAVLEIEMRADGNAVVRKGENAQIPTVYVNSLSPKKTVIILSVMNMGLTTGLFRPRLGDCPPKSDPSWCPLDGSLVQIPPQQRHDFKLELSNMPSRQISCAVEIWNQENKKIAKRSIIIKKNDRCICAFFCKCICFDSAEDLSCTALSKREYNDAGYFDPIPRRKIPHSSGSSAEPFKANLKIILLSMLFGLLLLGIIKAILGFVWRRLGVCGIGVIVGPRTLSQYYEYDISCFEVVYDECGFPVHPESGRAVQVVPRVLEAFLNIFFFYLYFLRIVSLLLTSIPCFKLICSDCEGCCKADDNECQNVDHSKNTHGIKTNYQVYNVMTFASKNSKSDENTFYNPCKVYEDPLEEDDTEFVLEEIKRYKKKNSD